LLPNEHTQVGESGCGKSTIAKLLQRFYDPNEGKILLDGVDLKDIALQDLRQIIGVVSQEPLLFDKSIRDNIRYGRLDASDDDIFEAARNANAHGFISKFPDGYDTLVGPRGGKLSGGQKQRVAIARALLRNPNILILDEATSALDNKSETMVQQALDDLMESNQRQRTTVVIAHRLSTIRYCDKIVVFGSPEGTSTASAGSVILEEGSHDELMKIHKGFYRALVGAGDSDKKSDKTGSKMEHIELNAESDEEIISSKETTPITNLTNLHEKKNVLETERVTQEKEQAKENKRRIWKYTWPELPLIMLGLLASICKGATMPILAVIFSEMIVTWFGSDMDVMRTTSLYWSFFFYGLAILTGLFEFTQKSVFERVGERLTTRLRSDTFRAMLRQDVSWFEDGANSVGVLSSRLSTDVKFVRLVVGQSLASALEAVAALATGILIAAFASWEIFLIMLAMVPLLGVSEVFNIKAFSGSEGTIRDELSKSTTILHETVNGIREVQAFSLESIITHEIKTSLFKTIGPASRKASMLKGVMMGSIQLIQYLVYAFAFWFGGEMIEKGRINFDDFLRALYAMAFAASGLGAAVTFAGDASKASAAVKAILETQDHESGISSDPWENRGIADIAVGTPVTRVLPGHKLAHGSAEFNNVDFAYPTRKGAKVFDGLDLSIPAGKIVAIVGSSGSGKSSVVQLLERFYDPISYKEEVGEDGINMVVKASNGVVSIDETDMNKSDCRWLRENIGLVGQEPILFNDTVYNNIALGKEGCTAEEVENAARCANAYEFITKLQNGFSTMVGNAGGKISGGQKQRIAIARALVKDPKILLLDEATSALDNESEKLVQASLDALMNEPGSNRTTIIIAHRLSTIKNADLICVLENTGDGSRVVEIGSHDELIQLDQKYKALVEAYER